MNKSAIQKFAIQARQELLAQVKQRAYQYGVDQDGYGDADADTVNGRVLTPAEKSQRQELIRLIQSKGYDQVMEEMAYTWFNRFVALRFMEVNNYLPTHIRVFSDASGAFKPEILSDVLHLELDGLSRERVSEYLEQNDDDGLYRYLLLTQCNALSECLPRMFEPMGSYTELLLPNNILRPDSVLGHMVSDIPEEDWQDAVQIIGWMYQYYNDERKNEVINIYKGTVKKEDIPAATQLFTTDWVVRYMVDNSLGRYWLERHPESKLAEKLEFFVTPKNGEIPHITGFVKPEDVKFLDPCMGSGHILVYAFDVLMEIYKESGYTERDAASTIVANNIFGLDIDERASQLAYFAVMMKARSYDRRFLARNIAPNVFAIEESNGMKAALREDLTSNAQMNAISQYLVETFRDAKELGSIITVQPQDYDGYIAYLEQCSGQGQLTLEDSEWLQNTRPMLEALARQAKVLSAKYPVVCTNPPYLNKIEGELKKTVTKDYKDYSGDLFSVFIYRNLMFCTREGYCGYMTPFVWMFIKTYEKLRELVIQSKSITTLVQMEYSAFEEATVPICTFVLKNERVTEPGLYFKLSDFKGGMEVQKQKVLEALADKDYGYFYAADQSNFSKIPGSPVAYWLADKVFELYADGEIMGTCAHPKVGMQTSNNDIYLRLWFEIAYNEFNGSSFGLKWIKYLKGGAYRKWYGNLEYLLFYNNDQNFILRQKHARVLDLDFLEKKKCTWTDLTSGKNSFRLAPDDTFYDISGHCFFPDESDQLWLLAYSNSAVFSMLKAVFNSTFHCQVGDVAKIVVPILSKIQKEEISELSNKNVAISKLDWDSYETSWDFKRNPLVINSVPVVFGAEWGNRHFTRLSDHYDAWKRECNERFQALQANEEELNRIFIDIYGLQDELTPEVADKDITVHRVFDTKEDVPESMRGSNYVRTLRDEIVSLISYAVGCMFGRYSLDTEGLAYAGGEWDASKYKTFIPDSDNIIPICDDEYFDDDITGRFVEFVRVVYGEDTLEENLKFVADALGGKGTPREVIRNYFLSEFYKDHCKTYQKRPIYWLFDSGKKNGFKALIYMHRYQRDLLARLRTDYVHEQQERYRTQQTQIMDALDHASGSERVKLTKQQKKLQEQALELRNYEEKIHHLADQNIEIDLDDGVKHNYALFEDVLAKIK